MILTDVHENELYVVVVNLLASFTFLTSMENCMSLIVMVFVIVCLNVYLSQFLVVMVTRFQKFPELLRKRKKKQEEEKGRKGRKRKSYQIHLFCYFSLQYWHKWIFVQKFICFLERCLVAWQQCYLPHEFLKIFLWRIEWKCRGYDILCLYIQSQTYWDWHHEAQIVWILDFFHDVLYLLEL